MLTCSFCGARADAVAHLLAGPDVNICSDCIQVGVRVLETENALDRVSRPDPDLVKRKLDALLSETAATCALVDHSRDRLQAQVLELRNREVPWNVIAKALGMSHQAAQERFS